MTTGNNTLGNATESWQGLNVTLINGTDTPATTCIASNLTNWTVVNTTLSSNVTTVTHFYVCEISDVAYVFCCILLVVNALLSLISNVVLIVTIYWSPSLKTPPNAHLVNICFTNLFLVVCMFTTLVALFVKSLDAEIEKALRLVQLWAVTSAFFQYLASFASIAYYRCRTIAKPAMSTRYKKSVVNRSIGVCWIVTIIISLSMVLAFEHKYLALTINPFDTVFYVPRDAEATSIGFEQNMVLSVAFLTFIVGLIAIMKCYYKIFKTLQFAKPICNNKVTPLRRASSTSDGTELNTTKGKMPPRLYGVKQCNWSQPYTISGALANADNGTTTGFNNLTVHYEKRSHSLSFEESSILEHPMRWHCAHRQLKLSLSNTSNASVKSRGSPEFTDISLGAELHRYQSFKHHTAMRRLSLRRDRNSLYCAAKNSLVMLATYSVFSTPVFICSVPGVLDSVPFSQMVYIMMFCKLLFFLNSPAYPIWYLVFSKRVRKCLYRIYENAFISFNVRQ